MRVGLVYPLIEDLKTFTGRGVVFLSKDEDYEKVLSYFDDMRICKNELTKQYSALLKKNQGKFYSQSAGDLIVYHPTEPKYQKSIVKLNWVKVLLEEVSKVIMLGEHPSLNKNQIKTLEEILEKELDIDVDYETELLEMSALNPSAIDFKNGSVDDYIFYACIYRLLDVRPDLEITI